MKKNILIFFGILACFSVTAFGFMNWKHTPPAPAAIPENQPTMLNNDLLKIMKLPTKLDLFYNVDSRFVTTLTKEKLHQATSIIDILPEEATSSIASCQEVTVAVLGENYEIIEIGMGDRLNAAQLKLLRSADYSSNMYIAANYTSKHAETGEVIRDDLIYYMTIVPEQEATFAHGQDALIQYLKDNSRATTAFIQQDQLRPGQVNFTISRRGTIKNVNLGTTSGYPDVDEALIELIRTLPGEWRPASNAQGETVDQEFVFFFGMQGC